MYLYQRPQALSTSSSSHKWLLIPVKLDTCQVLSQLDKWAHDTCECTETEISCNSHVQVSIYLSSYVYCSSFTHPNVVLNLWLPSVEHRRYFWRMFLSIWLKSTRSSLVLDPIDIHCVYKKGFLIFKNILNQRLVLGVLGQVFFLNGSWYNRRLMSDLLQPLLASGLTRQIFRAIDQGFSNGGLQ